MKTKWQAEEVINGLRCYARTTRSEITVRVEKDGDTSKYAEWGMPKLLGLRDAMKTAALQTVEGDIRE